MERQVSIYGQAGEDAISFRSSGMRIEHFPYGEWRSALNYAGGKGGGMLEGYCPPQGEESLRRAIAAHLRITRGIRADAEQIVLFSGSMQGIVLLVQLLLEPGNLPLWKIPDFMASAGQWRLAAVSCCRDGLTRAGLCPRIGQPGCCL